MVSKRVSELLHLAVWSQPASLFLQMTQVYPSSQLCGIPLTITPFQESQSEVG